MPTDRYPANPLDGPSGLAEELREIKRRLAELEAARPVGQTTLTGGTLRVVDANGDLRAQIGRLTAAGGTGEVYGIEVLNQPGSGDWPDGEPFFRATEHGAEFPYQTLPAINDAEVISVSAGTFTKTWTCATGILLHRYVSSTVIVVTPVGTTGELRLSINSGAVVSDPVTIGSGAAAYFTVPAFEHGLTLWTGPHFFDIEARLTGGAGTVDVYQPALGVVLTPR